MASSASREVVDMFFAHSIKWSASTNLNTSLKKRKKKNYYYNDIFLRVKVLSPARYRFPSCAVSPSDAPASPASSTLAIALPLPLLPPNATPPPLKVVVAIVVDVVVVAASGAVVPPSALPTVFVSMEWDFRSHCLPRCPSPHRHNPSASHTDAHARKTASSPDTAQAHTTYTLRHTK